jgi:hypothetical protein
VVEAYARETDAEERRIASVANAPMMLATSAMAVSWEGHNERRPNVASSE